MRPFRCSTITFLACLLGPHSVLAVPDPRFDNNLYRWLEGPQVLAWTIPGWKGRELEVQYFEIERQGDRFTIKSLTGSASLSGEGEIDREKVSFSFRLSGPGRYEYLHVTDSDGLGYGGASGTMTFGKTSEGVPNQGHWTLRSLPPPESTAKPADVGEADAMLKQVEEDFWEDFGATGDGRERYDVARSLPDSEAGGRVRMWLEAYDIEIGDIDMREDVARIEPPEDEIPPFHSSSVFDEHDAMRRAMEKRFGDPVYVEKARILPGGKYLPLFEKAAAMKGWEDSVLRVSINESKEIEVRMALNARDAGRLYGLRNGEIPPSGIMVAGPVSASAGRRVIVWFEPVETPKEDAEEDREDGVEEAKSGGKAMGSDAIDALLAEITPPRSYESARNLPDTVDAKPVRLTIIGFETDQPYGIIREDVARIEPFEDEMEEPVDPQFVLTAVLTDPQMDHVRPHFEKLGQVFTEEIRVVPGGKMVPLFAEESARKGWEDCSIRALGLGEDGGILNVGLALKSVGAPDGISLNVSMWTGQWVGISGPVTTDHHRAVFVRTESTATPKEEADEAAEEKGSAEAR